jgi:electron transport complex protein RnfC
MLIEVIKGRFSFFGGTNPPVNKSATELCSIQPGPVPNQVIIHLSQHTGAVCEPIVKKGETVKAGQKIADHHSFISAPVHSPTNGVVREISLQPHPVLGSCMAIVIDAVNDSPAKQPPQEKFCIDFDEKFYTPNQIYDSTREAGIVGLGGAGFPTAVKILPNPRQPKDFLLINGCECEPYITCDYRIMLEWTYQIIAGIKLARHAAGCRHTIIAIEKNKLNAAEIIQEALSISKDCSDIQVAMVKTKYPQGGERQLIESVLGKVVPTGSIPALMNIVVLNVATCAAIAEAVVLGSPLTHRVVTVTGQAIAKPGNYYVPIGTTVGSLIDFCGGVREKNAKVILGGPMMGYAISDLSTPLIKTTNAVTVLTEKQIGRAKHSRQQTPCFRCGRCLEVCPERLNPTKIAHAVKNETLDLAQDYFLTACIECGCCSYVCPANIELTGYIKNGKLLLAKQHKKIPECSVTDKGEA